MMKITAIPNLKSRLTADLLVLPFYQTKGGKAILASPEKNFSKWVKKPLQLQDFKGELGELFVVYPEKEKEKRLVLLGLGSDSKMSVESLRKAFAKLTKFCHKQQFSKLNILFPHLKKVEVEECIKGVCEGLLLANYVFDKLKNTTKTNSALLKNGHFLGLDASYKKVIQRRIDICEGVNLARDLVNENADTMNADKLSEIAKDLESKFKKISTTIFDKQRLEKEKLKLMLAVNRGTDLNPALILIHYKGNPKDKESTVLLGKGISYDTGGIQLKPAAGSIIHMKCDMGGAAAVLGTLHAAAKLDLPLNIVGVIPACENAISEKAYKPGDVYESYLGKTVEILSTDAEGRLLLADALAYAEQNLKPKQMIDLATLTGGVVVALGDQISGLMSNNKKLAQKLILSGERSGESVWELPLHEGYKEGLKSSIADLRNKSVGAQYPAAVIAGLFLQEFVQTTPWAHLDIAGTAYLAQPKDYQPTKATGVGVRLVIAFLEDLIDSQEEF